LQTRIRRSMLTAVGPTAIDERLGFIASMAKA
jgi:hypothetical protein